MLRRSSEPSQFDKLEADDHARIARENISFTVVTDCGGTFANHHPKKCADPNCGAYRASSGRDSACGPTPLIALRRLPAKK